MSIRTQTGALTARWSVLIVLITAAAIAGMGYGYTNHVQRQTEGRLADQQRQSEQRITDQQHRNDLRWCQLLASLDQPAPASTERGRLIQAQIHQLRTDLGCVKR